MRKTTQKLIVRTLKDKVDDLERAIHYCEKVPRDGREDHIKNLNGKVERLNAAMLELEKL